MNHTLSEIISYIEEENLPCKILYVNYFGNYYIPIFKRKNVCYIEIDQEKSKLTFDGHELDDDSLKKRVYVDDHFCGKILENYSLVCIGEEEHDNWITIIKSELDIRKRTDSFYNYIIQLSEKEDKDDEKPSFFTWIRKHFLSLFKNDK